MAKTYTVIAAVITAAIVFTGCGKKGYQEPPRPIKYMIVEKGDAAIKKEYSGVSKNITESELSFRVSGMIEELPIKVGQKVAAGQMLARLDPTDYEMKAKEMEAEHISAEADLKRYRALYEEESATKQELDDAQARADIAKAQYDLAKQELSYTVLKAPAAGQVVETPAEAHENVKVGQIVCILETGKEMEVKVGLPEYLIGWVKKGDKAKVSFKSIVERSYEAVVTEVGVRIDNKTGTFPVTVQIVEHGGELRAGMVADVKFVFTSPDKDASETITVPTEAVLEDPKGDQYVWIFDPDKETVSKRKVEVERLTQGGTIIRSGLESGEIIATAGAHYLREGQKVKLLEKR
ncbi:MAG: efflux RND transporter periplasmic adaptor subunit [Candidatus Omnitrophota bacterium]|nr:efflux RND transporter periplasmic adaptor subunit [Candidatus Omnitrophota bacterium]